jgi:polyisoprenoid-binding protein YceI
MYRKEFAPMIRMLTLGLAALVAAQDGATTYYVGHSPKFVNITFTSDLDLEVIVGTTNVATGEIVMDGKGGSVSLTVPVDSMKTGIAMRDEHLRNESWLDAAKFPTITFKSTKVAPVQDKPGQYDVAGDMTIHGVTKSIQLVVTHKTLPDEAAKAAKFPEGKWAKFTGEFDVKISDFGIHIPPMVATKVADVWKIKLAVYGCTTKPQQK